jgi:hypothetical protein
VVCPYCGDDSVYGSRHGEIKLDDCEFTIECEACEKTYFVKRYVDVKYSTWTKREDDEEKGIVSTPPKDEVMAALKERRKTFLATATKKHRDSGCSAEFAKELAMKEWNACGGQPTELSPIEKYLAANKL